MYMWRLLHFQAPSWQELHRASKLAKWSGFCYYPAAELPGLVQASVVFQSMPSPLGPRHGFIWASAPLTAAG